VSLSLFLFTTDAQVARQAVDAGVSGIIVDLEHAGKHARQDGFDTEINADSPRDLARLRDAGIPRRLCRVNRLGLDTKVEIEAALASGATDLILPMVATVADVGRFLELVAGRARAGILVETADACKVATDIARLPVDFVYVGLNDLAISRRGASIFDAVADGTVERLRHVFSARPFGFGGLTVVDGGAPVPCIRLLEEMARLECSFAFLRRSFKRDIVGRDMQVEVEMLQARFAALRRRSEAERRRDHATLIKALAAARSARKP
jgi:hypothetical protein